MNSVRPDLGSPPGVKKCRSPYAEGLNFCACHRCTFSHRCAFTKEALIKSNGDAASAMPISVLLNRICAMQMHQTESRQEPLNSALISGSLATVSHPGLQSFLPQEKRRDKPDG